VASRRVGSGRVGRCELGVEWCSHEAIVEAIDRTIIAAISRADRSRQQLPRVNGRATGRADTSRRRSLRVSAPTVVSCKHPIRKL